MERPRVAIIGGGFGGIATAVYLLKAGIGTFTIFEKNAGPGGTWWENTYPGAEVDQESHLYCLSFKTYNWSRNFARQAELLEYIEEMVDEFGLRSKFRFETKVERVVWNPATSSYTVSTSTGAEEEFEVVVSAVGLLNYINYPDWPGLEEFRGPKFHTARWDHDCDLRGKRVAVVGTGSTSAQVVPAIAPVVRQLYLFQREPGHVLPKGDRDFTPAERAWFSRPLARRLERLRLFKKRAALRAPSVPVVGSRKNRKWEQVSLGHIRDAFPGREDLADLVTPRYPFYGKRPLESDQFYPALQRDNVELIPRAVARLTEHAIVDSTGVEREIDVCVIATGFQPANFLAGLEVVGREGRTLHDVWAGEPKAFLGIAVAGFPNFYMLYGPNTNGGEILFYEEQQAKFAVRAVKRMARRGIASIEVRSGAMELYNKWLQRRLRGTAFGQSAYGVKTGYYRSPTGTVVTQWNQGVILYWLLCRTLGRVATIRA
jgi:cation diffusion facilitator CzcD-associated flavoprotein CzcO